MLVEGCVLKSRELRLKVCDLLSACCTFSSWPMAMVEILHLFDPGSALTVAGIPYYLLDAFSLPNRRTAVVKVCIQTFALLYIAAFPCIPSCLGIMSQLQLIIEDYVIKFERNSFRVQLSARGTAI